MVASRQDTFQDLFKVDRGVGGSNSLNQSSKKNKSNAARSDNIGDSSINSSPNQAEKNNTKSHRIVIPLGNPSNFTLNIQSTINSDNIKPTPAPTADTITVPKTTNISSTSKPEVIT